MHVTLLVTARMKQKCAVLYDTIVAIFPWWLYNRIMSLIQLLQTKVMENSKIHTKTQKLQLSKY